VKRHDLIGHLAAHGTLSQMSDADLNIAMGQMRVEAGLPDRNLARASGMIAEAARRDCRFVVLPECLDLGWTHPSARTHARPIPGKYSRILCQAARAAQIYVVAGLTERAGDRIYNAAVLISPEGRILLKHRKINELDIAHDLYSIGGSLSVVETPYGTVGVNVCADNFTSSLCLGHALGRMGAQLLLSPCAWAVPGDHDPNRDPFLVEWKKAYPTLARLYEMTVIGVSCVGPMPAGVWAGRRCIGCSLAFGPDGAILVQGPYGENAEALLVVKVTPADRRHRGTQIAGMLKAKGYEGP
jgi:predicted amidohydrolase